MFRFIPLSALAMALASPAFSKGASVYETPCERGPLPHVNIINNANTGFVDFIQQVRPKMPRDIAGLIAYEVCNDMTLVGDSPGLSKRLGLLIRKYGY